MRKNFGGELREQPGEIIVSFTISPRRHFEHALAAGPQLLGVTLRCHFTRPIRHLLHLRKKLILRRAVPALKQDFLDMEERWLALARSLEFSLRLGDFSAQANQRATKLAKPTKAER